MNDDDLREMFHAQRRDDARRAPPFDAMWTKRRRSPWRFIAPIATVAAAAAVLVVWCGTKETAPTASAPVVVRAVEWDPAPLDFLLDTPGLAALSGTPDFGKGE